MGFTIAISGKGGSGKTTLAGMLIRYLTDEVGAAVLAVDADPNSSLGELLGAKPQRTIADVREEVLEKKLDLPPGISKERHLEYLIQSCLVEERKFDLLTMGRPEGPKCYCYVNNLLRRYLDEVSDDYPFVVMDTEAGMEHLSRRTTDKLNLLLVVGEPTVVSARSIGRILGIADELPIEVTEKRVILNEIRDDMIPESVIAVLRQLNVDIALRVPYSEEVYRASSDGRTIFQLSETDPAYRAVTEFARRTIPVAAS